MQLYVPADVGVDSGVDVMSVGDSNDVGDNIGDSVGESSSLLHLCSAV